MHQIFHIIKYKLLIFINYNRIIFSNRRNLIRSLLASVIFIAFGAGTFLFSYNTIQFVIDEMKIGSFLLHRFSSILLFVFFLSISAGNIVVAYSIMFKSDEVYYLITRPIEFEKLFFLKMIESILYSSPTFLLIGSTILIGYGVYYKLSWFFYPFAIIFVFLPFVFVSAFLGVIILTLLIQVAGKIGIRWTIFSLIAIYLTLLTGFFRIINPKNLVNEVMKYYPNLDFNFSFLDPLFIKFLPNHWFSEALFWFTKSNFVLSFKFALLINLTSIFLLIVSILIGIKFYYKSFLVSLDLRSKKEIRRSFRKNFSAYGKLLDFENDSIFRSQTEVLLKKEFHQFFRDPSQWIHLGVIIFLIFIFIISIVRVDLISTLPFLKTVTYLSVFIFNSFLVSSITLRFVYPLISIESQAFWKIKSAPINARKILLIKFTPLFFITLLIAEALNFFSHSTQSIPYILKFYSVINIFSIALTLASMNFLFGNAFATFNEKNPVKIASSQGATIAFLFNIIYLVILVALLLNPINKIFSQNSGNKEIINPELNLISLILLLTGILVAYFSFRSGLKAIKKDY